MDALLRFDELRTEVHRSAPRATMASTTRDCEAFDSARGILVAALASVLLCWLPIVVALRHL